MKSKIAGILFLLSALTALLAESFATGKVLLAAGLIAVACYTLVTLLLYYMFAPVNKTVSLVAVSLNVAGLACEALRWSPQGADIALVFHGLYCLLIGYLAFTSSFLPRIVGGLMAFAGLGWMTYLSPPVAKYLSPYNLACGLLGEASLMLWLLLMGVNRTNFCSRF